MPNFNLPSTSRITSPAADVASNLGSIFIGQFHLRAGQQNADRARGNNKAAFSVSQKPKIISAIKKTALGQFLEPSFDTLQLRALQLENRLLRT